MADPLYVEQLPTRRCSSRALEAYNAGQWEAALAGYTAAAARRPRADAAGPSMACISPTCGLAGRPAAEDAFGKIVALGLATNNLAVKLLFRPGTTDFLADPHFGGVVSHVDPPHRSRGAGLGQAACISRGTRARAARRDQRSVVSGSGHRRSRAARTRGSRTRTRTTRPGSAPAATSSGPAPTMRVMPSIVASSSRWSRAGSSAVLKQRGAAARRVRKRWTAEPNGSAVHALATTERLFASA